MMAQANKQLAAVAVLRLARLGADPDPAVEINVGHHMLLFESLP